ncbi:response regulator transcription factor [Streptococcus pluranimalium]
MFFPILIVDDEVGLMDMVEIVLKKEGFQHIVKSDTGQKALTEISKSNFQLIILDVMLPDIDGFTLCSEIRKITYAPIIFLSAKTSDFDKLNGFMAGGDDYITKPYNPLDLVARVKAISRRQTIYQVEKNLDKVKFSNIEFDINSAELWVEDKIVNLPAKEFELLKFFCLNPNHIFSSSQLYESIWGMDSFGDDKTVSIHVMRLRKKIEKDYKHPELLVNVRGLGYKFVMPKDIQ